MKTETTELIEEIVYNKALELEREDDPQKCKSLIDEIDKLSRLDTDVAAKKKEMATKERLTDAEIDERYQKLVQAKKDRIARVLTDVGCTLLTIGATTALTILGYTYEYSEDGTISSGTLKRVLGDVRISKKRN